MALFYFLLIAAIVLIIIGATVDGMLYLVSAGVLLLIADFAPSRREVGTTAPSPGPLTRLAPLRTGSTQPTAH